MDSKNKKVLSDEKFVEYLMQIYYQSKDVQKENSKIILFDECDETLNDLLSNKQEIKLEMIKFIERSTSYNEIDSKENIHRK